MFFDSHAHLDDERFDEDREQLISGLPDKGVCCVVNPGADITSSTKAVSIAESYDFVYAAVGVHPHEVSAMTHQDLDRLAELSQHNKVVAIGEIGLDYYYDFSPRDIQKKWFEGQIELAYRLDLPIIIHDRDAHQDILDILRLKRDKIRGGVMHCYSGSWDMAKILMDLGLFIAIGGSVTFKNAKKLVEVAQNIPLDKLLIETDSPYLTPVPYRGKRNDPGYVRLVAEKIAQLRGMKCEEIGEITAKNAIRLFRIQQGNKYR